MAGKRIVVPPPKPFTDDDGTSFESKIDDLIQLALKNYEAVRNGTLMRVAWDILDKLKDRKDGDALLLSDAEYEVLQKAIADYKPDVMASYNCREFYNAIRDAKDPKEPDPEK